jgi:hypothetical protein
MSCSATSMNLRTSISSSVVMRDQRQQLAAPLLSAARADNASLIAIAVRNHSSCESVQSFTNFFIAPLPSSMTREVNPSRGPVSQRVRSQMITLG